MKYIKWLFAIVRIKLTKDYGMCCNEEQAIKCVKDYYLGKTVRSA